MHYVLFGLDLTSEQYEQAARHPLDRHHLPPLAATCRYLPPLAAYCLLYAYCMLTARRPLRTA